MNEALAGMMDGSAVVRQFAASTIGNAAMQQSFAVMAQAAVSHIHKLLTRQGERHRRRRAVKLEAVQNALAVDALIRALGQILEHHEAALGAHAAAAWSLWLTNLPIKYNVDAGQAAHAQLVDLVTRNHPSVASPQNCPRILTVFAEVYHSK